MRAFGPHIYLGAENNNHIIKVTRGLRIFLNFWSTDF